VLPVVDHVPDDAPALVATPMTTRVGEGHDGGGVAGLQAGGCKQE
jgi:hypothetical protein